VRAIHLAVSLCLLLGVALAAPSVEDFLAEWRAWHAGRLAALQKPQGWLSLVGLHWLKPGENRIPGLPGAFDVQGDAATLHARAEDGYSVNGKPVAEHRLASDATGAPDRLQLGSRVAVVIARGGRLALRVWDADSPVRAGFKGIDTFPPDPRWRITARWEPFSRPRQVQQPSVTGTPTTELVPGRAVFTVGGREVALTPTQDGDGLFFVFKDGTAPRETYGGGRVLTAKAPRDGAVVLDFNRAYNPPCAFTSFATCPLPLPENVLPLRVEAGEKVWSGGH
jgi:uncharacterized protein (DUF1684 family)